MGNAQSRVGPQYTEKGQLEPLASLRHPQRGFGGWKNRDDHKQAFRAAPLQQPKKNVLLNLHEKKSSQS